VLGVGWIWVGYAAQEGELARSIVECTPKFALLFWLILFFSLIMIKPLIAGLFTESHFIKLMCPIMCGLIRKNV
jgi:hypothetical protein